jgi:dCTP deaminase
MARTEPDLFTDDDDLPGSLHPTWLLPAQHLKALFEHRREIQAPVPIEPEQLQPASLDLRLGATAWRVRASFLPGEAASVRDKIDAFAMHRFELSEAGAVLEKGCVYIVELMERLALGCGKRSQALQANDINGISEAFQLTLL